MEPMPDPDPRAAFAAMTKALITNFRANGGQVGMPARDDARRVRPECPCLADRTRGSRSGA